MRTHYTGTAPDILRTDFTGRNAIAAALRKFAHYDTSRPVVEDEPSSNPLGWLADQSNDEVRRVSRESSELHTLLNPRIGLGNPQVIVYIDPHTDEVHVGKNYGGTRQRGREVYVDTQAGGRKSVAWWVLGGEKAKAIWESDRTSRVTTSLTADMAEDVAVPEERTYNSGDFRVGAKVWTTDIPGRRDLNNQVVTITRVDPTRDRFFFDEAGVERYGNIGSSGHVVVKADGKYVPGTPVRVVAGLVGALPEFLDAVAGRHSVIAPAAVFDDSDTIRVKVWPTLRAQFSGLTEDSVKVGSVEIVGALPPAGLGWKGEDAWEKGTTAPAPDGTVDGLTAAQWKAKWDRLWEALGQEANDREWCGEYDAFARANGGPERPETFDVQVAATVEWGASEADSHLRSVLVPSGSPIDVSGEVTITHRFWVNDFKGFNTDDMNSPDDRVFKALAEAAREKGYQVTDVTGIESWNHS